MRLRIDVIVVGVSAAALLSGCDPTPTAGPALPSTPSVAATPAVGASQAPASGAAAPAAPTTAATTDRKPARSAVVPSASESAATGCPSTAETLLAALRGDQTDMFARAGSPAALVDATCYQGYAVARTAPDGQHDPVGILFRFDPGTSGWRPMNLGSADFCGGVPATTAAHLPGCA
jgi:hypothetical protein